MQVHYHFGPASKGHAWIGGGIGYEWWRFSTSVKQGGQSATASAGARGFEFLNFQVGGDFPLSGAAALGPFVAVSVAQYDTAFVDCSGDCTGVTTSSERIDNKAFHEWLFFGVRGAFLP